MARRGANQPSVGGFNQAVILDQIRRSGGLSRVELAALTGLSAQTVSNITQRLMDAGIVEEAGRTSVMPGPGKPRTTLRLAPGSRFALGVHIDPSMLSFVMLGIDGEVIARHHHPTPDANDPDRTVQLITRELERLVDASGVERSRIVGTGIAAPGPIDAERGVVVDPPNLTGWHRVPLRAAIGRATGFPVVLDKDVTAAAVAERWVSSDIADSFAFLYLGTGLGLGLMLAEDVLRGGSGNAGEIGHIVTDPAGPPCACGLRGCVAVSCTPAALVAEAESLGILPPGRSASDPVTVDHAFSQVIERAAADDPLARALLARAAERVARALSVACNMLDVDRVVMGGPLWTRLAPWFGTQVPAALERLRVARGLHDVQVVGTALGDDVGAIGAACLILDEVLTPRPTSLLLN